MYLLVVGPPVPAGDMDDMGDVGDVCGFVGVCDGLGVVGDVLFYSWWEVVVVVNS